MTEPIGINRETRRAVARVAARPPARTVEVVIDDGGAFDGWAMTARADFPAALLVEFESGSSARVLAALELIVLEHNLPNDAGELAEHLADVSPYDGLMAVANAVTAKIGTLPPR